MKCDELNAYVAGFDGILHKNQRHGDVYLKDDVDAAIAELKEENERLKDELESLKARIAELERMDTEHTVQIAKMNGYIHHLEEERRWRKFSEEKPEHHQDILCYCPRAKFCKVALRRWDEGTRFDVFNKELYTHWMRLPEELTEDKIFTIKQ